MFTHPALLRQMNLAAEFLRTWGEAEWARRLATEADRVRKSGWTEEARRHLAGIFSAKPSLYDLTLTEQNKPRGKTAMTLTQANLALSEWRQSLADLMAVPTVTASAPGEKRKRSPDLPPS